MIHTTIDLDKIIQLAIKDATVKKSLQKKASSMGTVDDLSPESRKMAAEMAALPKYKEIVDRVSRTNGIVNFVTGNQYQPLVEKILQLAIPPSTNDIYHMGVDFTIPGDYDVDARQYFGVSGASKETQLAAIMNLQNLILGTPVRLTPEYLAELGWTDDRLMEHYGRNEWPIIRKAFGMLKDREAEINRGQIKASMATAHKKIVEAYQEMRLNEAIRKKNEDNAGKPGYEPLRENPVLSVEQIQKLKKQFESFRSSYMALKAGVVGYVVDVLSQEAAATEDPATVAKYRSALGKFSAMVNGGEPNTYSQKIDRQKNGFMHWNPSSDFRQLFGTLQAQYRDSIKNPAALEEMKKTIAAFVQKMRGYTTSDREALAIKQKLLDIIGETPRVDAAQQIVNFRTNKAQISSLIRDFINRIKNHGSFVVFSNVDNSILTNPASATAQSSDDTRAASAINMVLREFKGSMESDETKGGSLVSGSKKAIILVSQEPLRSISNDAVVIDMSDMPVDGEEAKVIVRNILEAEFGGDYKETTLFKSEAAIEQAYNEKMQAVTGRSEAEKAEGKTRLRNEKQRELKLLDATLEAKLKLALPTDEAITEIEEMIVGLGQKQAIEIVRRTLQKCISYERDANGEPVSLKLEGNKWVADVMQAANKQHDDNVPGLSTRRPKVEFKDYIFAKKSSDPNDLNPLKWGDTVGSFAQNHREFMNLQKRIKEIDEEIVSIAAELAQPSLSVQMKEELEVRRANYMAARDRFAKEKMLLLTSLPHFMILYGKPGVGKTVFADALGSLFGFVIRSVNFSNAKDKWVGSTEKYTKRIMDVIKTCRNTVVLIDELDRMVHMDSASAGGGGASGNDASHPVDKGIIDALLKLTEDNAGELVEHNVFIIITTNFLGNFDKALESRAQRGGGVYEVQAPNDPEDYKKFLETFLNTEKKDTPKSPWLVHIKSYFEQEEVAQELSKLRNRPVTIEDYWKELDALIRSVDMDKICRIFAQRRLGFRALAALLRKSVLAHNSYELSKKQLARGETREILGMPFNTANLAKAASIAKDGSDNLLENTEGISEVSSELRNKINEKLKNTELQMAEQIEVVPPHEYTPEEVLALIDKKEAVIVKTGIFDGANEMGEVYLVDPATKQPKRDQVTKRLDQNFRIARVQIGLGGQIVKGYQVPYGMDLDKEMTAVEDKPVDFSQYETSDEIVGDPNDPNARRIPMIRRKPLEQPPVGRSMEELQDTGMIDMSEPSTSQTPTEGQPPVEENQVTNEKNKAGRKSTTDYYYDFLKKSGVFEKKAQAVAPKAQNVEQKPENPTRKLAGYGVYYYNQGQVFVAPAGPDEKPQILNAK